MLLSPLKELQALQKEKDHICREKEALAACIHEKEKTQEGTVPLLQRATLIPTLFSWHSFKHFLVCSMCTQSVCKGLCYRPVQPYSWSWTKRRLSTKVS